MREHEPSETSLIENNARMIQYVIRTLCHVLLCYFLLASFPTLANVCLCEDGDSDPSSVESEKLLKRLIRLEEQRPFTSLIGNDNFHVNVTIHMPETDNVVGYFVSHVFEYQEGSSLHIARSQHLAPLYLSDNQRHFRLLESGQWYRRTFDWRAEISSRSHDPLQFLGSRLPSSAAIDLRPVDFAIRKSHADGTLLEYNYYGNLDAYAFGEDGNAVWLTVRSPSDEIRFGYPLSSVWHFETGRETAHGPIDVSCCLHSFVRGKEAVRYSAKTNHLINHEQFFAEKELVTDHHWKSVDLAHKVSSKQQLSASRKMYRVLAEDPESPEVVDLMRDIDNVLKTGEQVHSHRTETEMFGDEPLFERSESLASVRDILVRLDHYASFDNPETPEVISIRDPFMRWTRLERLIGSIRLSSFFDFVAESYINCRKLNDDAYYELCGLLADVGFPIYSGDGSVLAAARKGDLFVDSIFRSRWRVGGLTDAHILACQQLLTHAESTPATRGVVVDTLLHMQAHKMIDQKDVSRWFRSRVIDGTPCSRFTWLTVLSSHNDGVEYLLQQHRLMTENDTLRDDISLHLSKRVHAVKETEQYDFLSKSMCEKVKQQLGES